MKIQVIIVSFVVLSLLNLSRSSFFTKNVHNLMFFRPGKDGVPSGQQPKEDSKASVSTKSLGLGYDMERYGYIAPSPRSKRHANCTKTEAGDWQWFDLSVSERSRGDEDYAVYKWFFEDLEGKGTFVELGAFTGIAESNSRFFDECLEWDGLLIEANPSMKQNIVNNRPHAHKIFFAPTCGTEGTNETVQFHSNSFSNAGQKISTKAYTGVEKYLVDVPCGPLSPVLETLLTGHVNFFSLDVEGAEAMVLRTIDWSKVRVDIMIAESNNEHCKDVCESRSQVREIIKKAGYKLYIDGIFKSDLFIHPSIKKTPPARFREGYLDRPQRTFHRKANDPPRTMQVQSANATVKD